MTLSYEKYNCPELLLVWNDPDCPIPDYIHNFYHKKPCPGSHESYNFGRPSLGYHYMHYILNLSDILPEVEK